MADTVAVMVEEVADVDAEVEVDAMNKPMDVMVLAPPTLTAPIAVRPPSSRRYEFQPPTTSTFLGADLSSNLMAPPKLNTVKKSRILVNPGKSMVEWMKIQQELAAKGPTTKLRRIGPDECATHNTVGDVWMAINDRVFDVSDYANYHPGGVEEIMKGAGQDATTLFNQIHRWVNFESILKGNLLGYFVKEPTLSTLARKSSSSFSSNSTPGFVSIPSTKFSEDDESVFLEIDSRMAGDVRKESWTVGVLNRERFILKVMVPPKVWTTHLQLLKVLTDDHLNINYKNDFKRIVITIKKPQQERWLKLGSPLTDHNQILDSRASVEDFYPTKLIRKAKLTRNSYLFTAVTHSALIGVPIGFHVQIRLKETVSRPFTPVILSISGNNDNNPQPTTQNSQELHFIIKIYPDGQFTSLLESMFNDAVVDSSTEDSSIPLPSIEVEMGFPRGLFDPSFFHNVENLVLLAGGTGITPFIRIIKYLYCRRSSIPFRKVVLLFFNETLDDVIWNKEWMALSSKNPSWFYFYPVISKPDFLSPQSWTGLTGRISAKLFEDCIASCMSSNSPSEINGESKAMICGSLAFNASCKQVLMEQHTLSIDDPGGIFIFNG